MAAFAASIHNTPAASAGVRRQSTAATTAALQPTLTFTSKPTRSVSGQLRPVAAEQLLVAERQKASRPHPPLGLVAHQDRER
jgi:hypothetical protein